MDRVDKTLAALVTLFGWKVKHNGCPMLCRGCDLLCYHMPIPVCHDLVMPWLQLHKKVGAVGCGVQQNMAFRAFDLDLYPGRVFPRAFDREGQMKIVLALDGP